MKTMTNEELFKEAFLEAEKISNAKYLNKEAFEYYEFSEKFEKKMSKLIAKNDRLSFNTRVRISRALIAALIALLVLFTGLMSVSASRQKIIEFFEKIYNQYTEVSTSEQSVINVPEKIEIEYTISDIPEGFILTNYESSEAGVFAVWENDKKEQIVFEQNVLPISNTIDNEHYYEKTEVNGHPAYLYGINNQQFISFSNGEYWFNVMVPSRYQDKLIELATNIEEKK